MAEQTETSMMRAECVIFYVDPKSVGSHNFPEKEQGHFPITNEHSSCSFY